MHTAKRHRACQRVQVVQNNAGQGDIILIVFRSPLIYSVDEVDRTFQSVQHALRSLSQVKLYPNRAMVGTRDI